MLREMAWLVSDGHVLASADVAATRRAKRKGLLRRDGYEGAFVLVNCHWVHTVGMRFPLDVAYVAPDGTVLKVTRMARYRLGAPMPKASWIIEAEAGAFERWGLEVGVPVELRTEDSPPGNAGDGPSLAAGDGS